LNALDYDAAGGKASKKWRSAYPNSKRWPVPAGKDPGDAYKAGENIRNWVLAGLPPAWHVGLSPYIRKGMQGVPADPPETEKPMEPTKTTLPPAVQELGKLLQRYPVRIVNTMERTQVIVPRTFEDETVKNRVSELVFMDAECMDYLSRHPDDRIDGGNFFNV
jgi:hypothetical protein